MASPSPRFVEALQRVLAHRLEHPVARAAARDLAIDGEQRLVVQRRQQRQRLVLVGGLRRRRPRPAASSRRRTPTSWRTCAAAPAPSMLVAPLHRRLQRLVARQRAAAAGEQAEAVVEARGDLGDRQHRRRARRPARSPARCRRGAGRSRRARGVVGVELEVGQREPRAIDEDAHRLRRPAPTSQIVRRRQRQRAHRVDLLARDAQALRGWWRRSCVPPRAGQQRLHQRRPRHRSHARSCPARAACGASARCSSSRSIRGVSPSSRDAEHGRARPRRRARRRCSGARSTNQTPSAKRRELLLRELQRQARLAAAADAGQRQQARVDGSSRAQVGERRLAADEAGARLRQVVARRWPSAAAAGCGRCGASARPSNR